MPESAASLLFVYNADSGVFSTLKDITHKIVSPETYACHLCTITHGTFSMHSEWKQFIQESGSPMQFLHRDEAIRDYAIDDPLPAVYTQTPDGLVLLLDREAINACDSIAELKRKLLDALESTR